MRQVKIDYKRLRRISPETARIAVLEYLSSNGKNISDCAKIFGVNRVVIYNIINKNKEGNLSDRSKAPKNIPNKTPKPVEDLIVEVAKTTKLPVKRLSYYLLSYYKVNIAYGTLRHILRRNKQI